MESTDAASLLVLLIAVSLPSALELSLVSPDRAPVAGAAGPYMAIDADPTNGTRPCSPIDATRTGAPTNGTYQVAICITGVASTPEVFEARVIWTGGVATAIEIPDSDAGRSDNPDFNDSAPPFGFGTVWRCNGVNPSPVGDDSGSDTAAHIQCESRSPTHINTLTADPGLLALITMKGNAAGTETFTFDNYAGIGYRLTNDPVFTCGAPVLCLGASVIQDHTLAHTETPTPTWTPTASATPTNTATPCPGVCPTETPTATPDVLGVPHLAIDADPTNGSRPCQPIDTTRLDGPSSGTYQVAICLVNSRGTPDAIQVDVRWTGGVAAAIEVPDLPPDALDDNPDFNNDPPPYGFGNAWSCPSIGPYYPKGDYPILPGTDAFIECDNRLVSPSPTTLTAQPGLLAMLTMQATGSGTEGFAFDVGFTNFNSPPGENWSCGPPPFVYCPGATVVQLPATATPTATSTSTPTSTPTATRTPTATNTPVPPVIVGGVGSFAEPRTGSKHRGSGSTALVAGATLAALSLAASARHLRRRYGA